MLRQTNSRFWSHVSGGDWSECWIWTAALNNYGYGTVKVGGKMLGAHRVAYVEMVGDIPEGLQLDHVCRNRACVNPWHLQPVTVRENLMRSPITQTSVNSRKTHCKSGHEFTPENTRIDRDGHRRCRICVRRWLREKRAREKAGA